MRFGVLGPIEIWDGNRRVAVRSGRQRALLACLLAHRDGLVSTDRLVEELWPADAPPTAAKAVRNLVSELRKLIGQTNGAVLVTEDRGYRLTVPADQIDAVRFEALATEGRRRLGRGDSADAAKVLREALDLWRGAPFGDAAEGPSVLLEAARLEELRLICAEDLFAAELALGRHRELVPELEAEIQREPLRERLRALLMLALYRAGRQADALAAYRDARRTLVGELGLEPSRQLNELEAAILAHDPALDAPQPGAVSRKQRARLLIALGAGTLVLTAAALALALSRGGEVTGLAVISANSVGAIDPDTGTIVAQVPLGAPVAQLAAAGNAVWALSSTERTLYRIDARRRELTGSARLDGVVADVAASDTAVSVLHAGASGRAVVTTYTADQDDPLLLGSVDLGVDFSGAGGASFGSPTDRLAAAATKVWVVAGAYGSRGGVLSGSYGSRGGVLAVDLRRERVSARLDIPGMNALAVGEGGVWLVGAQRLSRLDRSSTVDLQIALPSPGYAADAAIGEGAVWALTTPYIEFSPIDRYRTTVGPQGPIRTGRGLLTRVDPRTTAVATTVELGGRPETVAAGLGSVWITEPGQNVLIRVDPETNTVAEKIPLGGRPTAVTLGGGLVWVSVV